LFQVGPISISEDSIPGTRQVAYQIAPRINAAGRMDHASVSYNLIIEKDRAKARYLALELESKNQERQKITAEIVREVEVLANNSFQDKNFIFAESEHWPVGILGLIAGKISDEFQKPTAIFQRQGETFVGSLRSVEEVNIIEILSECSDLLIKFGGHSQAAGVTIAKDKLETFYEKASLAIDKKMSGEKIEPSIDIDLEIRSEDIDWEFMTELKKMEPFGNGNPEPVFLMKDMKISDRKICGNGTKHLKMSLRSSNGNPKIFDSIGFGMGEKLSDLQADKSIDIVFNLCEDEWNGNKKMQLKLIDFRING
jgi:single-stranded-DNA-specific exonuclease